MWLSMTHASAHPPQLADRTESLNRSIKKRYAYLLFGILKDRVGEQLCVQIMGCGALGGTLGGLGGPWKGT